MRRNNILVMADFAAGKKEILERYLFENLTGLVNGSKELFENKLLKWRKAYEAVPAEPTRMFPFQNASNLVIPVIGIHVDTLHARIMSGVFKTPPLFSVKAYGRWAADKHISDLKAGLEEYMNYCGVEPAELDLYRVYNEWYLETIKYGTSTVKIPWEEQMRDFLLPVSAGDIPEGGYTGWSDKDFKTDTIYEGPRPEKIPFDCFGIRPTAKTIAGADFKYHRRPLLKHELQERAFRKLYDKDVVKDILASPDRPGPNAVTKEQQQDTGIKTVSSYSSGEWDIYECYVQWRPDDDQWAPKLIVSYHLKTRKILRIMFDNFKDEWFVGARLGIRDDMYHGIGFAELLWYFQEEISEKHNGRNDNQTVANTRVWRVNTDSKLHQGYRIYPSAMLPADKDEIEPLAHGEISSTNMDEEKLSLELAERRSGVSPPQQGFGAGTMSGKRGTYSAMGTMSMLQEGNRRTDLTISDMRDAHTRLGRILLRQYHDFGKDSTFCKERYKMFGDMASIIEEAIEKTQTRQLSIPVYASTSSVNKEVEKQSDIMMTQIVNRHYQMVSQLLMQLNQPAIPPPVKEYSMQVIDASNYLMRTIMKNFGHDDVEKLIPDPLKKMLGGPNGGPGQQPQPGQAPIQGGGGGAQPPQQTPPPPQLPPPVAGPTGGDPV